MSKSHVTDPDLHFSEREGKRRKTAHAWLDLEAQVAHGDDEEEDDAWEIDDELFIEEPTPADSLISHAQLQLELDRANENRDAEWSLFLERATNRVPLAPPNASDEPDEPRTFVGKTPIWRVPVKAGWEEIVAFKVLEKELFRKDAASPILSATGRASCPGFILVETQSISGVRSLSPAIENIYPNKATVMPPEVVLDCLGGRSPIWTPQSPGWVRLSTLPYRGDLAFISQVDPRTLDASLMVVPRIDYTLPGDLRPSKPKKRAPQALFNPPAARTCFGQDEVQKRNHVFVYGGKVFENGFLKTDSREFTIIPKNTMPTVEELYWFRQSPEVPAHWLDAALDLIKSHTLQPGNAVKILSGGHKGAIATALGILDDGTVQLRLSTSLLGPKITFNAPVSEVRKHITVGDEAIVIAGPHKNTTGWVVAVGGGDVEIFNHETCEQVAVPASFVEFHSAEVVLGAAPVDLPLTSFVEPNLLNRDFTDPNRHLIGRSVQVINKSHYKAYRGIVKEALQGDFVIVELAATMRRHRVRLCNLTLTNGKKMRPIDTMDKGDAAKQRELPYIPPSALPLTPSTPLPTPLTGTASPAWDPASRTPSTRPTADRLSWMLSPLLQGKRFKIVLANTKPLLRDPGFKGGIHEGKLGLWVGVDEVGNAKVTLGVSLNLSVPLEYVETTRPSIKGQTAAATQGPFVGGEYIVVLPGRDTCVVKPRKGASRGKGQFELDTQLLAVIT